MTKKTKIVHFSRLLRVFELNGDPAYIIELEENNEKKLYISYHRTTGHCFLPKEKGVFKKEFTDLSDHCLFSQCTSAKGMFSNSPITHFKGDCSNLIDGTTMFYKSKLREIDTPFPLLENGHSMFGYSKIKEINIEFPKLEDGLTMFDSSSLEFINCDFPLLSKGSFMFANLKKLKKVQCHFPKLKENAYMFHNISDKFKKDHPYYFI